MLNSVEYKLVRKYILPFGDADTIVMINHHHDDKIHHVNQETRDVLSTQSYCLF